MANDNTTGTEAIHQFERAGLGKAPFRCTGIRESVFQAAPGEPIRAGSSCDFCGTSIRWVFSIASQDGRAFKVGCDCVAKTGDAGLIRGVKQARKTAREAKRAVLREAAATARYTKRAVAARARKQAASREAMAFITAADLKPIIKAACRAEGTWARTTACDLVRQLMTVGGLSLKQVDLLRTCAVQLQPAPSGKVTFEGEIRSVKRQEYGYQQLKCVILADAGFKVYCTLPAGVMNEFVRRAADDTVVGCRVSVTATLEPSRDDRCFAFAKRPKAELLAQSVVATLAARAEAVRELLAERAERSA